MTKSFVEFGGEVRRAAYRSKRTEKWLCWYVGILAPNRTLWFFGTSFGILCCLWPDNRNVPWTGAGLLGSVHLVCQSHSGLKLTLAKLFCWQQWCGCVNLGDFYQASSPDVLSWWCLGGRRDGFHAGGWLTVRSLYHRWSSSHGLTFRWRKLTD